MCQIIGRKQTEIHSTDEFLSSLSQMKFYLLTRVAKSMGYNLGKNSVGVNCMLSQRFCVVIFLFGLKLILLLPLPTEGIDSLY